MTHKIKPPTGSRHSVSTSRQTGSGVPAVWDEEGGIYRCETDTTQTLTLELEGRKEITKIIDFKPRLERQGLHAEVLRGPKRDLFKKNDEFTTPMGAEITYLGPKGEK